MSTEQTILLIDDDKTLLELLAEHLQAAGYRTVSASDGPSGLNILEDAHPDLVVLDVMMPDVDGWEVSRRLRTQSSVPIILLTAKSEELDKLRGFRLGVDDYVTKPFSFAELVARVGAVLARAGHSRGQEHSLTSDDLAIDFDQRRVTVGGHPVDLTRTEYRLLEALAHHANRTVATEQLIQVVWGPEYAGELEQVKHFIWTLRKKIEVDPGNPKHLITERGFGYRLE
ncbi:MAG TPA: response regulator transcription factor [Aggregatilineales bacterium]|nr:response regulator transcription factor [Aggregatilineales bacterium]